MKDSEFIELLNLYLDHEISPADASRLEAEVQSNPERRRVYRDYCMMQKACKALAQDFAGEPAAEPNIVELEQTRGTAVSRGRMTYVAGTFIAAAACVALVFVVQHRRAPTGNENAVAHATPVAAPAIAPAPALAQMVATTNTEPLHRDTSRHANDALSLRNSAPAQLTLAGDPNFEWLKDVRLTPIQAPVPLDQLKLDLNQTDATRTYSSTNKLNPADITIAIKYTK